MSSSNGRPKPPDHQSATKFSDAQRIFFAIRLLTDRQAQKFPSAEDLHAVVRLRGGLPEMVRVLKKLVEAKLLVTFDVGQERGEGLAPSKQIGNSGVSKINQQLFSLTGPSAIAAASSEHLRSNQDLNVIRSRVEILLDIEATPTLGVHEFDDGIGPP